MVKNLDNFPVDKLFEVGGHGSNYWAAQLYRSKSRPAEYFVNKCYWQYNSCWAVEVGERERVKGKKSRAGERRTAE